MTSDTQKALDLIFSEYPSLKNSQTSIFKQFISPSGRSYNTFLLKVGNEVFVAKGVTGQTASVSNLETEYQALKILNGENAPKLIYPNHKPVHYLLIEYLEGDSAADLISQNKKVETVFALIGNALGKIHHIKVDNFGSLIQPSGVIWSDYVKSKFSERINGIKNLIDEELFEKTISLFHSLEHLLDDENKQPPVIVHRDAYSENFIIDKNITKATLIDFAMAIGGRPFFDIAKFFVTELYEKPQYKNDFLTTYQKDVPEDKNFADKLTLYIILECAGFIGFNHVIKNNLGRDNGISVLKQTVNKTGVMKQLLS